jgi:hypothetical protein
LVNKSHAECATGDDMLHTTQRPMALGNMRDIESRKVKGGEGGVGRDRLLVTVLRRFWSPRLRKKQKLINR